MDTKVPAIGLPLSISTAAANSLRRCRMSSPSTTPMCIATPALAQAASSAALQARGFTPPALATTLMPRALISGSSGAITCSTKSVA